MPGDAPDPINERLQSMSEAEAAEWSCRTLIRSLLLPPADETPEAGAALDYARRTLEAGAESMLRRAAAIEDEYERIDAFGDIEFVIEGAVRITIGVPAPQAETGSPSSPDIGIEKTPEVAPALRRRGGRPLGLRAPIIAALRKLYPAEDPVAVKGLHRELLRSHIASELGVSIEKIDPRTMDRARAAAWNYQTTSD